MYMYIIIFMQTASLTIFFSAYNVLISTGLFKYSNFCFLSSLINWSFSSWLIVWKKKRVRCLCIIIIIKYMQLFAFYVLIRVVMNL